MLTLGCWKAPDRKAQLEPNVLYSWHTGADRRVDLAVRNGELTLNVVTKDQQRGFYQIVVRDDEISTYHPLHYGSPPGDREAGVNLDSKSGKITKFMANLGDDSHTLLIDTNDDLRFDQQRMFAPSRPSTLQKIEWSYSKAEEPNKAPEPTPGSVTPRASSR
jgi:hypothetical protein